MTPLKLCANLKWLFTELAFDARFAAAAETGFTAVEYASPYEYAPRALRKHLADNGLRQILINTPAGAAGTDGEAGVGCLPGANRRFRDGVRRALDYAGELNCGLVHVMAGCRPAGLGRDRAFGTFLDNLEWAVEHAAGSGIRLVLEAMNPTDRPAYLLETQEEAAALVQAVDPHALGVLFDVYHCARSQGDVVARLEALSPWIAHVQVADPPSRTEPGSGEVKWHLVFRQLRTGYDGWIGCEYRPATTTVAGLGWIRQFGVV